MAREERFTLLLLPYKIGKQAETVVRRYKAVTKTSWQIPEDVNQNAPILASLQP